MTIMYLSSKGPTPIDSLPYPYLCNALAKLEREGVGADRTDEVAAMRARKAVLEAEQAVAAPAPIGHNGPPEPTPAEASPTAPVAAADPFEALRVHIDDLYTEARNWADGQEIATEAQGAEVDRLIADFKTAIRLAESLQDAEIKPLNIQIAAIRQRFYPLIGETKAVTGTAIRALKALLAVKTRWAHTLAARRRAEADRLRQGAADQARAARDALAQGVDNIDAAETAEDLIKGAQGLLQAAKQAEAPVIKGLRTVWVTTIDDSLTAVRTMWRRDPQAFQDLALSLAQAEVRRGVRTLAGFTIAETKVAS